MPLELYTAKISLRFQETLRKTIYQETAEVKELSLLKWVVQSDCTTRNHLEKVYAIRHKTRFVLLSLSLQAISGPSMTITKEEFQLAL